ncbi:MAG: small conductance mechanosensitive channel [Bradymonadia bacterium]|jgi:small conductance mechanosensitive channel
MPENFDFGPLIELATMYGVRVIGALVFLFIASKIASYARRHVDNLGESGKLDKTLARFAGNIAYYVVIAAAAIACLGIFGIETTSFAALIGAAGLAIGLAFQGSLSNLAAGVMLIVFRPFNVGDVVNVGGVTGKVDEIELFTTILDTADNRRIIMPNSVIFGGTIENITHHDTRRVDVSVGIDYSASIPETRAAMQKALDTIPNQTAANQVVLTGLGASSVDYQLRVWVPTAEYFSAQEALTVATKEQLDAVNIGIPYQTFDVNITK